MNPLVYPILVPFIGAVLASLSPKRLREFLSVLVSLATFIIAFSLYPAVCRGPLEYEYYSSSNLSLSLRIDFLSLVILILISFLGFLSTLYSLGYMKKYNRLNQYYFLLLAFIGSMNGAAVAGDLLTLFLFWEFMTLAAFFLVMFDNRAESIRAAIKYFLMSEMGALCMLLGIIGIYHLKGTISMSALSGMVFRPGITHLLLLSFLLGAGVKAGIIPFHTWLPDAHPAAPSPVSALLSGVMIKLGIYVIIRVFWQMFLPILSWQFTLCAVGSLTIIIGVMMALVQHDSKRLLAYHSVSQIGYIILGIGTGVTIGVAGGLFHLINHAIFKSLLFLCMGAVIYRTEKRDLDHLGGLARFMPLTFLACLVASLSISGVPPFNGFVSKWMIYQGLIEMGREGGQSWIIWLAAAMFGSALTLASFMKLIHAVFLGRGEREQSGEQIKEVSWRMWLPMVILACLCIILGIFPYSTVLNKFILPVVGKISYLGSWEPLLATLFILVGFFIGTIIYLAGRPGAIRESVYFAGGEMLPESQRVTGVDFYQTIREMGIFKGIYQLAGEKIFDVYDQGKNLVFFFTGHLRNAHTGILTTYLFWIMVGFTILFLVVVK